MSGRNDGNTKSRGEQDQPLEVPSKTKNRLVSRKY
ncbi:MAG: hypothetical protein K0R09_3078 [Clostridiales bacterium]|jgi:hypothetical protein|nr:hypothetical protein [Clostridiales bacterium]